MSKINCYLFVFIGMALFILGTSSYAENSTKDFFITVRGRSADLRSIQIRSELKMAKNTDFCRGALMPAQKGSWLCKAYGRAVEECRLRYHCKLINKNFSRKTQTEKLSAELSKHPKTKGKFKIWVSKRPVRNSGQYRTYKEAKNSTKLRARQKFQKVRDTSGDSFDLVAAKKKTRKRKIRKVVKKVEEIGDFEKEIAEMEQAINNNKKELKDLRNHSSRISKKKEKKEKWKVEKSTSPNGKETTYHVVKKVSQNDTDSESNFRLWGFGAHLIKVTDQNENSLAAFDLSWTPEYKLKNGWSLVGHVGGHFLKTASVLQNVVDETFLVFDFGANIRYRWKHFYGDFYLGTQKWNDTLGEMYSSFGFGGGYRFEKYLLKYIDGVNISIRNVSNELKNTEWKVGITISF